MNRITELGLRLLARLLRLVQLVANFLFSIWYRSPPQTVPTLTNALYSLSATSLAQRIRNGKVTSTEVVKAFIDRIEQINPILNCVVEDRFSEALAEAAKVDELIASKTKTPEQMEAETPLLGIPFTTKDAIAVKGLHQTSGLVWRKDVVATEDAHVIALMRRAGAIPMALTNVPEFCMWWESSNHLHGTTNNPYDTRRMPGGSSGGEGSCLSAAGSPLGIGSDIAGSIRMPGFFNGIFGHKHSSDIIPMHGHFPPVDKIREPYLSIGPMSRYSQDLLTVMKIISPPELRLHDKVDVTKLRYYYLEDFGCPFLSPVDAEIKKGIQKIVTYYKKSYGINVKEAKIAKMRNAIFILLAKLRSHLSPFMAAGLNGGKENLNLPLEFVKVAMRTSEHTLPAVFWATIEQLAAGASPEWHKQYTKLGDDLALELQELLGDDGVLILPTNPTPALYHNETIIRPFNFVYTGIINVVKLPSTQCPIGQTSHGLPIGIQVVAGPKNDRLCLAVAQELEKAFGGWVCPPTRSNTNFKASLMN